MPNFLRSVHDTLSTPGSALQPGRRELLRGLGAMGTVGGIGALGGMGLAGGGALAQDKPQAQQDCRPGTLAPDPGFGWQDPEENLRLLSRMWGTIEPGEEAYLYVFGPAFGVRGPSQFYPLFRLESLANVRTYPVEGGGYRYLANQVILFCDFRTNEVLKTWENPYTGETVEVFHYRDGPLDYKLNAGAFPERYRMENADPLQRKLVLDWFYRGDMAYGDAIARTVLPNKLDPDIYPRASVGSEWETFEVYRWQAKMREMEDPSLPSIPSFTGDFQTFKPWEPWMLMGQTPGKIFSVRTTFKPKSLGEVPCHVRDYIERELPEFMNAPTTFHGQYKLNDSHYREAREPVTEPLPAIRDI